MKTSVQRLPDYPARVLMEVEVDADRVEQAVEQAYRRIVRQLRIPGFRPGRAPRKIVELHVGKEALLQEAVDDLIPKLYVEATRENNLDPVDRARIDIVDVGVDKPLKFTAEVDVKPDVALGPYKGVAIERRVRKIEDADVEQMLEQTRQRMAQLVHVDKEALEQGDFAVIDFDGFIDGTPFPGGAARGETVEIGAEGNVPEFDQQLIGLAVDEEREFQVTFPDTAREDLQGQQATFRVKLLEIKQRVVPELDDELAKDTGQFDTLDEMRSDYRQRLEQAAAEEADNRLRTELVEQVSAAANVEIPEVMVDDELEHMMREMQMALAQSGIHWEHYLAMLETTEAGWKEQNRDEARQRVKRDLVLEAIGRAEGLEPDEEAVDERLRSVFGPGREDEALAEVLADEDRRAVARVGLLRSRALEWLVEHAQVTDVEYVADEDAGEDGDETDGARDDKGEAPAAMDNTAD